MIRSHRKAFAAAENIVRNPSGYKVPDTNGTAACDARIYGDGRRAGDSAGILGRVVVADGVGDQRAPGTEGGGYSLSWKRSARSGGTHAREACAGGCAAVMPPGEDWEPGWALRPFCPIIRLA